LSIGKSKYFHFFQEFVRSARFASRLIAPVKGFGPGFFNRL
jgi:hypothetical protein